jgi:hypothetical protein
VGMTFGPPPSRGVARAVRAGQASLAAGAAWKPPAGRGRYGRPGYNGIKLDEQVEMSTEIVSLDAIQSATERHQLLRGQAIQAYALLEQSLCNLFAFYGDMDNGTASIIFFELSSRARNKIIKKLISRKCADIYCSFWISYLKELRRIDEKRNQIVHWLEVKSFRQTDTGVVPSLELRHPDYWNWDVKTTSISEVDVNLFIDKCGFFWRAVAMFIPGVMGLLGEKPEWFEIYHKPIVYPPPKVGDPLFESYLALRSKP